jgi:hypothetical protein
MATGGGASSVSTSLTHAFILPSFRDAQLVPIDNRQRVSLRVAGWAMCSAAAVVLVGGGLASWVAIGAGAEPLPVWGQAAWWVATSVFALLLWVGCGRAQPTVRRFVITSIATGVAYVVLGSALLTIDPIGAADPSDSGSGWGNAIEGVVVFAIWVYGNGVVALVAPLVIGLLPVFRPALVGRPATWSGHSYTSADDDAAAEDFNIY